MMKNILAALAFAPALFAPAEGPWWGHVAGRQRDALGDSATPRWNFHKYLVGADGKLVAAYSTQTEPLDAKVIKAVETELAKAGS